MHDAALCVLTANQCIAAKALRLCHRIAKAASVSSETEGATTPDRLHDRIRSSFSERRSCWQFMSR